MSYSLVNKAEWCSCSSDTVVSPVYLPSSWANVADPKYPRSHWTSSGLRVTTGEPPDKHRSVWLDSSGLHSSWALTLSVSLRPICLLILLQAEWKSMGRDTFGGPSACHITHQSVGSSYLGPVTWTVAEQAAWLIRFFLQIADQWLWVGRWIFSFPLPLLFFLLPFARPGS